MTTSKSSFSKLKAQATKIAVLMKAAERGETLKGDFGGKMVEARNNPKVKVGIAMDDKLISIEIAWATIKATSESALTEYILKHMRGETVQ